MTVSINWQKLIDDLVKSGLTQSQIGEKCGVTQPAIQLIYSGKTNEPRYSLGERLLALHVATMAAA